MLQSVAFSGIIPGANLELIHIH